MNETNPDEEFAFIGDITDYWTYTQVRDRLLLMPQLTDPAMRTYLIVRSMIVEAKKHMPGQGLRRMTIDQMCFLLSRDSGKPVSVSVMYQILTLLKDLDLMVPLDTKQDVGAAQMKGKERAVHGILRSFVVRDLPPVPYTGWRNAWDKLNHYRRDWRENPPLPPVHVATTVIGENGQPVTRVTQMPQDVAFQNSGTAPEPSDPEQDPFQDSGKLFQDSGTPVQDSGTDSPPTSENALPKEGSPRRSPKKNNTLPDGRRPTTGSTRASNSGSAASGKPKPAAKFSKEQRQQVTALFAALPKPLADLVPTHVPANLTAAVLEALAAGRPEERTVQQLIDYRLMPKWDTHYGSWGQAGKLDKPVGVLIAMLKRNPECGDGRCDERMNVDTGEACRSCEMRAVDQRANRERDRAQEQQQEAGPEPATEQSRPQDAPSVPAPRQEPDRPSQACRGAFPTVETWTPPPIDAVLPNDDSDAGHGIIGVHPDRAREARDALRANKHLVRR